ncbi:GGDEF domain protein [Synechococcus sp. WH 8101]|uniref:TackOD1 domain-containing metal-binding protein n=1 Tax=Synechococcus sp. WH 8101 TaxID=59932 RepID=UPI00164C6224|nr:diguanylate cyclase [Synechococcus sp. WH 8101]QNI45668.1 GGDEF domain protein [Synechococcus sp. WH 8101]
MARLAWVSLHHQARPPEAMAGIDCLRFSSVPQLLEQSTASDVVVLDGPADAMGKAALGLRRHTAYQQALIYTAQPGDDWCAALTDGIAPNDPNQISVAWSQWNERLQVFNRGLPPQRLDHRVLCWLWLRPTATLLPVRDCRSAGIYRYPLVEAIAADSSFNSFGWLQQKRQENLLEAGSLTDRIRQCSQCQSSRLNYVDVCPECHGLDIARQPSLHCFVCGHVAPQQEFLKGELLICPNCLSRLRHIGSDYDRPMENYRCRDCSAFFIDAEVDVRCFDCDHNEQPDDLRVREVRHFGLSETGRLACHQGLDDNALTASSFQRQKLMGESDFLEALNWQMAIARRYSGSASTTIASVLGLKLMNLEALLGQAGEGRTIAMLDNLVERLMQVIRDTDRCMRGSEDVLWLLLPQASAGGLQRLQQRLEEAVMTLHDRNESPLELRFVGCVLPDQIQTDEDAPLLLARLNGDLN